MLPYNANINRTSKKTSKKNDHKFFSQQHVNTKKET